MVAVRPAREQVVSIAAVDGECLSTLWAASALASTVSAPSPALTTILAPSSPASAVAWRFTVMTPPRGGERDRVGLLVVDACQKSAAVHVCGDRRLGSGRRHEGDARERGDERAD